MEFALAALFELFESLDQCAPGSRAATLQALQACEGLAPGARIVDFGCGPGPATVALAQAGYAVTAVDRHGPFIETVRRRAAAAGVGDRVTAIVGDMRAPDFADGAFDAVWSEGAAYSVGVPAALAAWRRLLAPAGWLVLSELCWREGARSAEAAAFWQREYPDMGDVTQLEARCAAAGYAVRGGFWLPADAWAAYYGPLEAAVPAVRARHPQAEAQAALDDIGREIALWRRFGGEFGYRFVVAQRG